jgi:hypothetical protein
VLSRRLGVHATDSQLLTDHPYLLQVAKNIPWQSLGEINEAVIVADIDVPDMLAFQARLIGDRADDVAGFDTMRVAYFQAEGFEYNIVVVITFAAPSRPRPGVRVKSRTTIGAAFTCRPSIVLSTAAIGPAFACGSSVVVSAAACTLVCLRDDVAAFPAATILGA